MTAKERRKQAWERLVIAYGIAIVPNLLAVLGVDFPGAWIAIRWIASAIFLAALIAFLVALWRERSAKRRERSEPGRPARS